MQELNVQSFLEFIETYSRKLTELEDVLNELDNRIGDGDHGSNMSRGFSAASSKLQQSPPADPSSGAQTVAMSLLSTVGGASGPLYSTVFMRLASAWKGAETIDSALCVNGFKDALAGLSARGKASPGDKTMIDVWTPVVDELLQNEETIDFEKIVSTAQESALATRDLVAKRGRASYLGERSQGTCDPGSISSAVFFEAFSSTTAKGMEPIPWQTLVL